MVWLFAHWFTVTDQIFYHSTMIWERYYVIIMTHNMHVCSVLIKSSASLFRTFNKHFQLRTTQWPTWTWPSILLNNTWTFQRCWTLKVRTDYGPCPMNFTGNFQKFIGWISFVWHCSVLCVLSRFDWSCKTRWKSYYDLRIMLLSCIQWSTKGNST